MLHEISELTKAEEEQRASVHFWIKGQEAERKRIALDIHDGIAQMIVSARFKLALYKKEKDNDVVLSDMDSVLQDTLFEIKNMTNELYPKLLELSGLHNAIQYLLDELQTTNGLKTVLKMDDQLKNTNSYSAIHLFRIIQEALKNIVMHAQAKEVGISIVLEEGNYMLKIHDDGVGFIVDSQLPNSNGLFHIKERVSYLRGVFQIESGKNKPVNILVAGEILP